MTFVVPFDGSELAAAALQTAVAYGDALEADVVAVSVVPERKRYAREKGWIDEDEPYDVERVLEDLRERVAEVAPDATFEYERIREFPPAEGIADRIERLALEHDVTVMFLGSDNVGRVVTPLTSVAVNVTAAKTYDVHVVRDTGSPSIERLNRE